MFWATSEPATTAGGLDRSEKPSRTFHEEHPPRKSQGYHERCDNAGRETIHGIRDLSILI